MEKIWETKEYMLPNWDSTFRLFAAHLRSVDANWTYPKHTDPLFEVNLVLEGSQLMIINGRDYIQHPGDMLLLKPGDVHQGQSANREAMTYYCLHFDVDDRFFRELLCRNKEIFYSRESTLARKIRPALNKLIEITTRESEFKLSQRMLTMSAVFELFAALSETLPVHEPSYTGKTSAIHLSREIAGHLEKYVEGNDKISGEREEKDIVKQISVQLGYSMSSCNRVFHQVYGLSPRRYLSALKLKKAKLLLMESELSIEDISLRLGYGDIAHFSRQFKRWTGESPKQFRNRFNT